MRILARYPVEFMPPYHSLELQHGTALSIPEPSRSVRGLVVVLCLPLLMLALGCGDETLFGESRSICEATDEKRDDCWISSEISGLSKNDTYYVNNSERLQKICNAECGKAHEIVVSGLDNLGDLEFLSGMRRVDEVVVEKMSLVSLEGIEQTDMETLSVRDVTKLSNLEGASGIRDLPTLILRGVEDLESLDGLSDLERLDKFQAKDAPKLDDLSELDDATIGKGRGADPREQGYV